MTRVAPAVLLVLGIGVAPVGSSGAPLCRATLQLEPEEAYLGQEILYRLRILRREDVSQVGWEKAPIFPDLRAEWLPGRSADEPVVEDGARYLAYEERRALFADRAGEHTIPEASLRCRLSEDSEPAIVQVSAARLRVIEPPAEGRPEDWSGIVGRIEVGALVEPQRVRLGETLRVAVRIEGEASVWNARPPWAGEAPIPGAELFPLRPELARDAGRRLRLRRYFAWDVVPRREGLLAIPEIRVPYFDPEARRYEVARIPATWVEVASPLAEDVGTSRGGAPKASPARTRGAAPRSARPSLRQVLGAAGVATALGLVAFIAARTRRRPRRSPEIEALLGAAAGAGLPDAKAELLGRALRVALAARIPGAAALTAEELRARARGPEEERAAELLLLLERARFAPGAAPPPVESVRAAVHALAGR